MNPVGCQRPWPRRVPSSNVLMRVRHITSSHQRADRSMSVTVRSMCDGPVSRGIPPTVALGRTGLVGIADACARPRRSGPRGRRAASSCSRRRTLSVSIPEPPGCEPTTRRSLAVPEFGRSVPRSSRRLRPTSGVGVSRNPHEGTRAGDGENPARNRLHLCSDQGTCADEGVRAAVCFSKEIDACDHVG